MNTFTNTVTSETTTFDGTGGCCGSTVYDKSGAEYPTGTATVTGSQCNANAPGSGNDWWMTKLVPPTTYVTITVNNPLDAFEILGLLGGQAGPPSLLPHNLLDIRRIPLDHRRPSRGRRRGACGGG